MQCGNWSRLDCTPTPVTPNRVAEWVGSGLIKAHNHRLFALDEQKCKDGYYCEDCFVRVCSIK